MNAKSVLNWIINLYKNYYFLILLIVGLGLVYMNSFVNNTSLAYVANAILTSGVFTAALKSFQYTEIFKQELGKVISNNEFLENLKEKRLVELWNDCTLVLCERRFPEISHDLFKFVRDNYLTRGLDYYYPEIQLTIELDYFKGNKMFIVSKETSLIKIKSMSKDPITYRFGSMIDKMSDLGIDEHYRLEELYVNNERQLIKPVPEPVEGNKLKVLVELPLNGETEYKIMKIETRVESLKTNSDFLSFKISRLTRKMHFNVKNRTSLRLDYVPFGTIGEFSDDKEAAKLHGYDISKVSTGFVMIGQGFVLLLKE
ncbi:MAG: hypothetical protein ACOYXT_09470 [Bacteroidota bacterium]